MEPVQKLVSCTIHANILILLLLLLPFVSSSQEQEKTSNIHKLSTKLQFQIKVHGFLLWASMGFLMPIGILTIRMSNREQCGRRLRILFYVHAISQTLSILIATTGAVLSIKNFNNSFNNHHQKIGVVLYGIIWLQGLIGFLRPQRGSKARSVWFFAHWLLGTVVSLLGIVNVYTGLLAYHEKTSRSISFWTIMFTSEISLVGLLYLFQDKWEYIQKQGVILGNGESIRPTDKEVSPRDMTKELMIQTC